MSIYDLALIIRAGSAALWTLQSTIYKKTDLSVFTNWCLFSMRQILVKISPYYLAGTFFISREDLVLVKNNNLNLVVTHVLVFILIDLTSYGLHVWSHRSSIGWLFHKLHHSDENFNLTTGFRTTVFSGLVNVLSGLPLVMLGFSYQVVILHIVINNVYQHLTHHNMPFSCWLNYLLDKLYIVSPRFHAKHHEKIDTSESYNYGCVFSIWDKIFKTYQRPPESGAALKYGVPGEIIQINPIFLTLNYFKEVILFIFSKDFAKKINRYDVLTLYFIFSIFLIALIE